MFTAPSASRSNARWFWAIALLFVAALVALELRQNYILSLIPARQEKAATSQAIASQNFYHKLNLIIGGRLPRSQVEAAVNGGKPIPTHSILAEGADGSHELLETGLLRDPQTGGEVSICFTPDGASWRAFGPAHPTAFVPPFPAPTWIFAEELRHGIMTLAPKTWWLLFLGWPFARRRIRPHVMGQLLSATGIAWLTAELIDPAWFNPASQNLDSYLSNFSWPVVAIAVGAIAIILDARGKRPDPNLCVHCSYDLTANVSGICPECGNAIRSRLHSQHGVGDAA
jgi:hypothetical protein